MGVCRIVPTCSQYYGVLKPCFIVLYFIFEVRHAVFEFVFGDSRRNSVEEGGCGNYTGGRSIRTSPCYNQYYEDLNACFVVLYFIFEVYLVVFEFVFANIRGNGAKEGGCGNYASVR